MFQRLGDTNLVPSFNVTSRSCTNRTKAEMVPDGNRCKPSKIHNRPSLIALVNGVGNQTDSPNELVDLFKNQKSDAGANVVVKL